MNATNLFLKTDNAGRKQPTILTCLLIAGIVFCLSLASSKKSPPAKKDIKKSIIKERDIIEAANNNLTGKGNAVDLDFSTILKPPDAVQTPQSSSPTYKSNGASPSVTKSIVFDSSQDYQSDSVVPLGSMVKCLLIHNIVTNNFEAPVIAQVWEDFYFDGKLLLPFGTRIYGTASSGKQRDRVLVKFDNIVFQNGKTLRIGAIGLSKDGSGGLTGTVVDEHNKQTFLAMALNFLSGTALGLQNSRTNEVTGLSEIETSSRNSILNGVANALQGEAQHVRGDAEASKGYAIVLAGSELVVYFEKAVDLKGG